MGILKLNRFKKIDGVHLSALKIINLEDGDVLHGMKKNDFGFNGFGEAYFSEIKFKKIKAWKRHRSMTLNLIVPSGKVRFVIYDDRANSDTYEAFQEVVSSYNHPLDHPDTPEYIINSHFRFDLYN